MLSAAVVTADIAAMYYAADRRAVLTAFAALFLFIVAVLITPAIFLPVWAGIGAIRWIARRRRSTAAAQKRGEDPWVYVLLIFGLPLFNFIGYVPLTWMPAERMTVNGSAIVGYVTSVDGPWTHVLQDQPRTILIYSTPSVTERKPCSLRVAWYSLPLLQIVGRPSPLMACEQ